MDRKSSSSTQVCDLCMLFVCLAQLFLSSTSSASPLPYCCCHCYCHLTKFVDASPVLTTDHHALRLLFIVDRQRCVSIHLDRKKIQLERRKWLCMRANWENMLSDPKWCMRAVVETTVFCAVQMLTVCMRVCLLLQTTCWVINVILVGYTKSFPLHLQ